MAELLSIGANLIGGFLADDSAEDQARGIKQGGTEAKAVLEPFLSAGVGANNAIAGALGVNGQPAQDQQFQNFLGSTGFKSQLKEGSNAIINNAAGRGLLNSGATLKRLNTFGQEFAKGSFSDFLANLSGVANRGINAATNTANVITGTTSEAAEVEAEGDRGFQSGLGAAFGGFKSLLPVGGG